MDTETESRSPLCVVPCAKEMLYIMSSCSVEATERHYIRIYLVLMNSRGTRPEKYREQFTISGVDVPWRGAEVAGKEEESEDKHGKSSSTTTSTTHPPPKKHFRVQRPFLSFLFLCCWRRDATVIQQWKEEPAVKMQWNPWRRRKYPWAEFLNIFAILSGSCVCTYSCFNDSVVVEQQIFHKEWVKGILKSGWVEYAEKESQMEWLGK